MKQKIPVTLIVELSDAAMQPDVDEAIVDAIERHARPRPATEAGRVVDGPPG